MVNSERRTPDTSRHTSPQHISLVYLITPATTLVAVPIADEDPPEPDTRKPIPTGQDAGYLEEIPLPQCVHGVTTGADHSIDWPGSNHATPESQSGRAPDSTAEEFVQYPTDGANPKRRWAPPTTRPVAVG